MQKESECIDAHAAGDRGFARAVHVARSDQNVRYPEAAAVLGHDLVLPHLAEAVRVSAKLRTRFNRARLVQQSAIRFVSVAVHRKGADAHEPFQGPVLQRRVEKIACRDDRVHEGVGKRFFAAAGGQVKDDRHISGGGDAIGA